MSFVVPENTTLIVRVRNTSAVAAHDAKVIIWGKRVVAGAEDVA
jgi:hypothetical protein